MSSSSLKLIPVLIPKPLWGVNAHNLLEGQCWQNIRRNTFLRSDYCCVICQRKKPLECHEVFKFDDEKGVAVLLRLEGRCEDCHACNHLGRLKKVNPKGFKRALAYIGFVNQITPQVVIRIVGEAFDVHKSRTRPWEMKVDPELLQIYPQLKRLEGHYSPP